jgi:hypothetical protein
MATAEQTMRRIDPAEDAKRRWAANPGRCINEKCRSKGKYKKHHSRGLCHNCYQTLWDLIDSKAEPALQSWEDAEDLGCCLKKQEVRPKRFSFGSGKAN